MTYYHFSNIQNPDSWDTDCEVHEFPFNIEAVGLWLLAHCKLLYRAYMHLLAMWVLYRVWPVKRIK